MPEGDDRAEGLLERVLVLVKGQRDGEVTRELLLRDGLRAFVCSDVEQLCSEMEKGTAVLLLAEEVLTPGPVTRLASILNRQPPWSDLPIVMFSAAGSASVRPFGDAACVLGNVTFLDRPVQVRSMLASVHAAIRARRRQYEAKRAIESRDVFLATLGHELRNPLGAIGLAMATLSKTMPESGRPKQFGIIERQARHLGRLVDDLLDVARITHGKVVLKRSTMNLADIVRNAFEALESLARDHSLSFGLRLRNCDACVDGDRKYLEQVFSNILTNAIKYTPKGGAVTVDVRAEDDAAVVTVQDTGIGIAPEMINRIFETFAQVDPSIDRAGGGIGLGLALVRSVVRMHGGTVRATSPGLGQGACFIVRLPRASAPRSVEQDPGPMHEHAPTAKRVVVIEDNQDIRELLAELLLDGGHDVTCAANGPDGLEEILRIAPDIAFVDLGIPGFDGFELARRARASGSHAHLVALTGYGQPEDKLNARKAGFDEHLTKPVVDTDVEGALHRCERPHVP